MSLCPLTRILAPLALAAVVIAGVARAETPAKPERLVQKVYAVADLIVPIPGMVAAASHPTPAGVECQASQCRSKPSCANANSGCCAEKPAAGAAPSAAARATGATCERELIKLIQNTVAPETWADRGGRGTIEAMQIGMAIVVNQTPEVQEQIGALLDGLRRLQDIQIALEVRVMSVGECLFEQFADDFGLLRQPTALLDACGMARLMDRVQGDRRANVLQAPKLTTFSGQEATLRVVDEQSFLTGLSLAQHSRRPVFVPQNEVYTTGFTMTVQPTLTPDRRTILLKLQAELAEAEQFPVTMFVSPLVEGGAAGQPIPIQQPTIMKRGITKVLGIPEGHTAVFTAGRGTRTVMDVDYCPVLGHIPFVCELFKTETPRQESDHLIFLVTPRVIINADLKACAAKCCNERTCGVVSAPRPTPHCAAPAEQAAPAACPVAATAAYTAEQLPMPAAKPAVMPCPAAPPRVPEQPAMPAVRLTPATPLPPVPPVRDRGDGISQTQVQLDTVLLELENGFFTRPEGMAWADLAPASCAGKPLMISPEVAERFCASTRQLRAAKMLAAPKLVTHDGRPATFHSGGYQAVPEVAATGVGARFEPFGTLLTFRPMVCPADAVRLEIKCEISKLHEANGVSVNGKPVPVADVHQMATSAEVGPARTIVMHVGPGEAPGTTKMLLVTPSVIHPMVVPMPVAMAVMPAPLPVAEEQAVPPPPPAVDPKLARLMRRYQEACAEGRTNAAKKLAAKCLEIDPTCFGRN